MRQKLKNYHLYSINISKYKIKIKVLGIEAILQFFKQIYNWPKLISKKYICLLKIKNHLNFKKLCFVKCFKKKYIKEKLYGQFTHN